MLLNMWDNDEYLDHILEGWDRSQTRAGVPYYVNHNSSETQWDHPLYVKLMEELVELDSVRYAAYRTALKLRLFQTKCQLEMLDLRSINRVFERHGYPSDTQKSVTAHDLYSILVDLYHSNKVTGADSPNPQRADVFAELTLDWLLNLSDTKRHGYLRVAAVKVVLATMAGARLSEKYRYYFRLMCDSSDHVSQDNMATFLLDLMQITELIGESAPFGGLNLMPAVDNCFSSAWKSDAITEDEFTTWMLKEPQTIVWLPTMHRLTAAAKVQHDSKCSVCKVQPIVGFRYRCLKCFNYDLCQNCFFTGRVNKKHRLKHPTQEYCLAASTKDDTKAFMRIIRNKLSKKHRNKKKLRYLPIPGTDVMYGGPSDLNLADEEETSSEGDRTEPSSEDHRHHAGTDGCHSDGENGEEERSSEEDQDDSHDETLTKSLDPGRMPPDSTDGAPASSVGSILKQLEHENRELVTELDVLRRTYSPRPVVGYAAYPLRHYPDPRLGLAAPRLALPDPRLVRQVTPPDCQVTPPDSRSGSEASEVEWLRDEKEKLLAKQEILESHNLQLEQQLYRLRHLLAQNNGSDGLHGNHPTLAALSQNGTSPIPVLPPTTPTGHLTHPLHQQLLLHHPTHQSAAITSTPSANQTLEVDTTFGQADATHFSLPSPSQSQCFSDEEAELQEMIDMLDKNYPANMTHSMLEQSRNAVDDMYEAAYKIGDAFSNFVGNTQNDEEPTLENDISDDDDEEEQEEEEDKEEKTEEDSTFERGLQLEYSVQHVSSSSA